MSEAKEKPAPGRVQNPNTQAARVAFNPLRPTEKPQEFYDEVKQKFAEARDLRLSYRPEGQAQYTSELTGELAKYEVDPWVETIIERAPINDFVECLFIGGGFSALLTAARLREKGVESIRIVERGGDVGGTWYWNRYPGAACDVSAYDYMPLLDELGFVPKSFFAKGPEIFAHCQEIARRYDLYDLAVFQTTVTSTVWDEAAKLWRVTTDRGDTMSARFVICANGTLSKPKLSKIDGMDKFKGHSFHSSRFDYAYCGADLSNLKDKVVGIIGTGASAVQIIPRLGRAAKELYVFQRTPSAIDIRDDIPTDPDWAASLKPGWQKDRIRKHVESTAPGFGLTEEQKARTGRLAPRGKNPPPGKPEYRAPDAHPRARRGNREGQGDRRGAEALVHAPLQAPLLRRRIPSGVQPAERPSCGYQRQGRHRDQREGRRVRRPGISGGCADLRNRVRGSGHRDLQRYPRRERPQPERQIR